MLFCIWKMVFSMETKIKLIFVDDESYVCEQIESYIDWDALGIEVIGIYESPIEALEQIVNEAPDILITDIKMPGMDGLDLIAKAKQLNPVLESVILSAYTEFSFAQTAMELGVKNYLLKPFSEEELEAVVEKICGQICNRRLEKRKTLEWRRERIGDLITDLQNLKAENSDIDKHQIQKLMRKYQDVSLLYDAMTLLLLDYTGVGQNAQVDMLTKLYREDAGKLYGIVADSLNCLPYNVEEESALVSKVKEYAKEHYNEENLNLQFIADNVAHLGVKYVGKQFLKETGIRFSEYLKIIRMEKAKQLLPGSETIEEVAEQIGLGHDIWYFYRLFKNHTGITPKEYKKNC